MVFVLVLTAVLAASVALTAFKTFVLGLLVVIAGCLVYLHWASLQAELAGAALPELRYTMANERDPRIHVKNKGFADRYDLQIAWRSEPGVLHPLTWELTQQLHRDLPREGQDSAVIRAYGSFPEDSPALDIYVLTDRHPPYTVPLYLRRVLGRVECHWEDEGWPYRPPTWTSTVMDMFIAGRNYLNRLSDLTERGPVEGQSRQERLEEVRSVAREYRDEIKGSGLDIPDGVLADPRAVTMDQGEIDTPEVLIARATALIVSWQDTLIAACNQVRESVE